MEFLYQKVYTQMCMYVHSLFKLENFPFYSTNLNLPSLKHEKDVYLRIMYERNE